MSTTYNLKIDQIVSDIGNKCLDLDKIQQICLLKENFIPYINAHPWDPATFSHGYPSLIVLLSELDVHFPGQGWDQSAHILITKLIELIEKKGVYNSSLFSGLTGINFSILCASKSKTNYQSLLKGLNKILLEKIKAEYLIPWKECVKNDQFVPPLLWDLITGLSGIATYLMHFLEDPEIYQLFSTILSLFCDWVCSNKKYQGKSLPSFFTPADLLLREDHQHKYQPGCIDTGIAHGICGILCILAKAAQINVSFQHLCEKPIQRIVDWLMTHLDSDSPQDLWSSRYLLQQGKKQTFTSIDQFHRDAWCYGALGITRALFLASKAIDDQTLQNHSIKILDQVIERFPDRSGLQCLSFCHGFSSFLTINYTMFLATNMEKYLHASILAAEKIIDKYDASFPFGFKTLASQLGEEEKWIDNPGILDGSTGTALALLLLKSKQRPLWLDFFAI